MGAWFAPRYGRIPWKGSYTYPRSTSKAINSPTSPCTVVRRRLSTPIPASTTRYWRRELKATDLVWGAFGENFTTEGLLEPEIRIGDRIRVGSAEFLVTQPRMPCFKLGVRFGRDDMVKRFLRSERSGFYLAVVREGEVARGDSLEFVGRDEHGVTVADIASLYARDRDNEDLLRRAVELPALPESWKGYFRKRLFEPDV